MTIDLTSAQRERLIERWFGVRLPEVSRPVLCVTPLPDVFESICEGLRPPRPPTQTPMRTVLTEAILLVQAIHGPALADTVDVLAESLRGVLLLGYCGALTTRLHLGDQVLLGEPRALGMAIGLPLVTAAFGPNLLQQDHTAIRRWTEAGHAVVDMESGSTLAACDRQGVPGAAWLLVTDLPGYKPVWGQTADDEQLVRAARRRYLDDVRDFLQQGFQREHRRH